MPSQPQPAQPSDQLVELRLASPVMSLAQTVPAAAQHEKLHFSRIALPIPRLELPPDGTLQKRSWAVAADDAPYLCPTQPPRAVGEPPTRPHVRAGALVYKLRCVAAGAVGEPHPPSSPSPTDADADADAHWDLKDTAWPPNLFVEINGHRVDFRRRARWGRDLPVDVTRLVRAGTNELRAVRMGSAADDDRPAYYAVLELFRCCREDALRAGLCVLTPAAARAEMVRRLTSRADRPGTSDADDELIVSTRTVTVGVRCPLSFRPMEVPVRGRSCLHLDCFDFDNFMGSRRRPALGLPPQDDAYKCPHCGRPARPEHLLVDGFLKAALDTMRAQAPLYADVKHIVVDDAGVWKPQPAPAPESAAKQPKPVEVICIDDD